MILARDVLCIDPRPPFLIGWLPWIGTGDRVGDAEVAQYVVAAADALDVPALAFEELYELLASDGGGSGSRGVDCYAVTMHRGDGKAILVHHFEIRLDRLLAFVRASSIVSPCVATLGNSGTNTL